jgi:hypothetical protein
MCDPEGLRNKGGALDNKSDWDGNNSMKSGDSSGGDNWHKVYHRQQAIKVADNGERNYSGSSGDRDYRGYRSKDANRKESGGSGDSDDSSKNEQ